MLQLNQKQIDSLAGEWCDPGKTEILHDGGTRAGKTFSDVLAVVQRAIQYPGSRHLLTRLRLEHLRNILWNITLLKDVMPLVAPQGGYTVTRSPLVLKFPHNNSEIWGLGLDEPERIAKIMGSEFSTAFIDEATQIRFPVYEAVKTRTVQGANPKIVLACNPASKFHWIYRYFIMRVNPQSGDALPNDSRVFRRGPWLPEDNEHLSAEGRAMLDTLTGLSRDRLLKGLWVNPEGLVYTDFEEAVIDPFKIPEHWPVVASVDFGYSNPFVMLFFAEDSANETVYLFDEHYKAERTVRWHCDAIKTRFFPHRPYKALRLDGIVADHDAEDRATMLEAGFPTAAADKDIRSGVQAVQTMLAAKRGWRLKVFSTCTSTRDEAAAYRWPDQKHGDERDEKPVKEFDHAMDALRYYCKKRLTAAALAGSVRKRAKY